MMMIHPTSSYLGKQGNHAIKVNYGNHGNNSNVATEYSSTLSDHVNHVNMVNVTSQKIVCNGALGKNHTNKYY